MIEVILRLVFTVFFSATYMGTKSAFEEPIVTNIPITKECYDKEQRAVFALEKKILESPAAKHTFVLEGIKECGLTAEHIYLQAMKRAEKKPLYKMKK